MLTASTTIAGRVAAVGADHARRWARLAAGMVVPYTLVQLRKQRRQTREVASARRELHELREHGDEAFDYKAAIEFLVRQRGLDDMQVLHGSMPLPSLQFAGRLLDEHLPADRPLVGVHVGNFVGVSLAYFSSLLRERYPDSIMISIDPNIAHRRIENPQSHVWALLSQFGLLDANLVVTAYSLEQSLGDVPESGPDVRAERRGEHALRNLAITAPGRIDVAVMDGNHDGVYLERELKEVHRLLLPGSIVVVDDVEDSWPGVLATFNRVASAGTGFAELGRDGRVGVLQLRV